MTRSTQKVSMNARDKRFAVITQVLKHDCIIMAKIYRRAGIIDLSICDLAKLFFDFGSDFHALQTDRTIPVVKIATNAVK